MDEQAHDILLTAAEVAVALIGFASLVGVFLARSAGSLPANARIVIRSLVDYGLLALAACGAPLLVARAAPEPQMLWQASSGLFLLFVLAYIAASRAYYREFTRQIASDRNLAGAIIVTGDLASYLAMALNAVGWPFGPTATVYLAAAVFWNLFGAAFSFRAFIGLAWSEE